MNSSHQCVAPRKHRRTLVSLAAVFALASTALGATPRGDQTQRADAATHVRLSQPALGTRSVPLLRHGRFDFKDLNRNGRLDRYEDWRLSTTKRVDDLIERMTVAELAATMMHDAIPAPGSPNGFGVNYDLNAATVLIDRGITSLLSRNSARAPELAAGSNDLQAIAQRGRLGIPLTISTDPRNQLGAVTGASTDAGGFSRFPDFPGLAATRDPKLVRRFADIVRREYLAVGIREGLSPQADLATEPRWYRISGTFGEDADIARKMVAAYVSGLQGSGVGPQTVMSTVKHFAGYGAQVNGWDSHNPYGKIASFSSQESFERSLEPYKGAFDQDVLGVMPTYSILEGVTVDGRPLEPVGAGFSRQLLTDVLRERFGFDGVILTDFSATDDCVTVCAEGFAPGETPVIDGRFGAPWGVEDLPEQERFVKAVNAGVDQFGGTVEFEHLVHGVEEGQITRARLEESAARILAVKFRQGLFENPYVDAAGAGSIVGNARFRSQALQAQRRSLVLLENDEQILPLGANTEVYLRGVSAELASQAGLQVTDTPEEADVAIVRASTPFEVLHPTYPFGTLAREGNLAFKPGHPDYEAIAQISAKVPTIVTVYMDRPAILTQIQEMADALVANFGVTDVALLDVLTGKASPQGRLPFELPSSMAEVEAQRPDLPHDTANPLYRYGFGLGY